MEFHPVCKFSEIGLGEGKAVAVAGRSLAIFNISGKLYAIDNVCPHMSAPLDNGVVNGKSVVCRLHFWEIDILTGKTVDPPGHCVSTHPVKVERGIVKIGLETTTQVETACEAMPKVDPEL
ncbi:MAG: Rieske 2Fe-2S domain-containing protein [Acidobacteriota bacterium]